MPRIPIVFGGPHVTAAVHDVMGHAEIDFAVLGEGEITFNELVDAIENNGDITGVSGLAFRKNGSIVINTPRPFIDI